MDSYLETFEKSVKFINAVLFGCGSNIFDKNWSQGIKGKLLRFIPMIIVAFEPVTNVTAFYYNWNDFVMFSQTIMITMTGAQGYLKMFILQFFYKDILEVIDLCRKFHIKYKNDIENERKTSTDMEYLKRPLLTIRIMCGMYFTAVFIKLMYPLFQEKRSLPMDYYLTFGPPFETPYYEINYVYELIQAPMVVHIFVGVDSIFILLISEACLQFDIIKYKLATVGCDEPLNEENENQKLREIYFMHEEFVRFVNTINNTFSKTLLVQFLSSFLMISCAMFMITASANFDQMVYCVAVFIQLSLYCWYGQLLKNKLDSTIYTMYNNQWYNLNIQQKKSLIIMMSCAQANLTLKAGGFSEICMETYLGILKTTYSYYAIMKDANEEM